SSLKRRKQILSDSNDDYYYTHPPSPQQASSLTTITTVNSATSTSTIPIQQLIPRGPLICSDSFEKWNERSFTWNRPAPSSTLTSTMPNTSTATSQPSTIKTDTDDKSLQQPPYSQDPFLEGDVSDDDTCFTSNTNTSTLSQTRTSTNYGSSQNLNPRKISLTESLRSLPTTTDPTQYEIFERLRQAEEEKKRLEDENRAMKQELVRTKSKISSLKREMSSIQQLHLAQQQVHVQLSAPSSITPRQDHHQRLYPTNHPPTSSSSAIYLYTKDIPDQNRYHPMTINMNDLSISSNDESVSPTTFSPNPDINPSSSTQTVPLSSVEHLTSLAPSSTQIDSSKSPSDEQLRLYLTETIQREKDSNA
ncbi:unnamed protein product, partial [Adineta ricciae]